MPQEQPALPGLPAPTSLPPDVLQVHQCPPPLQTKVFLGWRDEAGFWKGKEHTSGPREATGLLGAFYTLTSPLLRGEPASQCSHL